VKEEPHTSKKKDAARPVTNWRSSKVRASRPTWDNTALSQHSTPGACCKSCSGVCGMLLATPLAEPGVQRICRRAAASLRLQAPASRAGGLRNMLVGLGFGILVLFSAFAASSSATAKTDGAPIDLAAMGSAWAKLDGFGTTDIGRPMQVCCDSAAGLPSAMPAAMRRGADRSIADRGAQATLPDVVQLIHRLAQAEQSAAEWAARYTEEAARVDELATRNVALLDQIANLKSLLTACTGAQPPPTAEASTAAALVVGPPSTAAPPEEAGVCPVPRWYRWQHDRAGMRHTACRVQPRQAACVLLRRQPAWQRRRPRTHDARHGAAGNTHRSRSHGPTANATIAASVPPFDLPHDGTALAPPSPRVHARRAFRRSASACRHARA
jgi:hypothetical protein